MIATLEELLAPISRAEFLIAFRERRRLYSPATDPTRAESLLSWQEIDALLLAQARQENLIVKRDGVAISQRMYTSAESEFRPRAFHDLLEQGASVVINEIDASVPQIGRLAVAIERELQIPTQINGYFSFSKGGAFRPHWDSHDVLILQVHGRKRWQIWNAQIADPIESSDRKMNANSPAAQELDLTPGDVLFIPRGEPHAAAVSTAHSVHLTIGLQSLTGLDFLDQLRKEAESNPFLRMNLPRHSGQTEMESYEICLKDHLHRLVDAGNIHQFVLQTDFKRRPLTQICASGALPQLNDELRLTLRRFIPLSNVAPDDPPQNLSIGGDSYSLTPAAIAIVQWLFAHDASTRRELDLELSARYGRAAVEAALNELIRYGFLARARANDEGG